MTVRIENPGAVFLYGDELVRAYAIGEGKSIHFEYLEKPPCPCCQRSYRTDLLEHSPLFQDNAKAVETLLLPASAGKDEAK